MIHQGKRDNKRDIGVFEMVDYLKQFQLFIATLLSYELHYNLVHIGKTSDHDIPIHQNLHQGKG